MHPKIPLSPSSHQFYDQQITHNKQQLQRKFFVQNYLLPNGSQYTGELINGKFDGQGILKFPNKERYEGQFSKGKKHGKGKYYYKSGQYYIGDWIDNKKEGNGLYIYDKDKWYEGEFKNNMKHGRGIIKETNGNYYKGSFFQNNKDQEGQYFIASEGKTIKFIFDKGKQICASEQPNHDEMTQQNKIDLPAIMKEKQFNQITSEKIVSQILQSYLNEQKSGVVIQNPNTSYISLHFSNQGTNSNEYSSKKNFIPFPANEGPQIKNETLKSIKISQWQVNQVCEWLGDVGFGDYVSQFRIHNITGFSLLVLNQQDLKQLNIASEQDRSVFLMQIKFLRLFFKTQCSKDQIVNFKNSDIDIELLYRLSKQDPTRLYRHQSMITPESSNSNFQQIEQSKMFKSLVKQVYQPNNLMKKISDGSHDMPIEERYSSSTSSSVQQGQQDKQKQEREEVVKKNDINKWHSQIHRKIEYEMRKKRIDTKIVIPNWQIQLLKPIGKGSYGEVHLAAWNGQDIAIKIYTKRRGFRNRHISRFLEQTQIAIKLLHPFIVLYMGIFVNDNDYAIVMQYMEGGSLFDHLHIMGYKLNESKILSICKNVALGMVYLHGKNILHGDLKSSNLLLDKNWKIKISDFSLSYIKKGDLTKRPRLTRLGTPQWMAPEVLKYGYYDFPCDVYSFGVVLWQLLTGQIPFRQLTQKQVFEKAVSDETLTLKTPKHTNIKLVNLFKNCTSADPSNRPSFNEIYDYLSISEKDTILKLHRQV